MTATTWTFAPAGVLGQGSAYVRPYPGVAVCPTPPAVQGTGLPAVAFAGDADRARLRRMTGSVAVLTHTHEPIAQNFSAQQSTQNDDTTLGIRSPGRPQS